MRIDTKSVIGGNIRLFREKSGKSIAELCKPQRWSRAYWNDLERGMKPPSIQRLEEIAQVLSRAIGRNVDVRDLLAPPNGNSKSKRKNGNGKRGAS